MLILAIKKYCIAFTEAVTISYLKAVNIVNIYRKIPVSVSLFNKVSGPKSCNFIEETPTQVFFCEYCTIFKNTYSE